MIIEFVKAVIKLRDSITLGLTSGLMGNLAKGLFNLFFWRSKKSETLYSQLAGSMFIKPGLRKQKSPSLIGNLADMSTGSILGVPLVYIMKKTGKDNYLIKGLGYGAFLWLLLYGAGHNLDFYILKPQKYKSNLSAFFEHIIFGISTAHASVKLATPGTFPDEKYDF